MAERDTYNDPYSEPYDPAYADQNRVNKIKGFYTQYLGREADQKGLNDWAGSGHDLGFVENAFKNSPEAAAWLKTQQTQAPAAPAAPAAGGDPYAFIRQWQQSHPASEGIGPLADALKSYGVTRYDYGGTPSNNELMIGGQKFKVLGAEGTPGQYWYTGGDDSAPGTGGPSYGAQPTPQGPQSDPMFAALLARLTAQDQSNAAQKVADRQKADALYSQLQGRAQQSLQIDRNDPIIRAQADAFSANQERASRNYLADLAEKAGPLANLQGEQRMAAERQGQAAGSFEAELMGRELTSRRAEIADALNSMRGMLSLDQQDNLQRELASLDAAIKQQGLAVNQSQFGQDLGYRYANLAQQGSQFDRSLAQSGSQFDRNLGFNYDNMDNALLRQLLQGLL